MTSPHPLIRPAFTKRWHVWGFLGLLVLLVIVTIVAPAGLSRSAVYRLVPTRFGDFWLQADLQEAGSRPLDVVFVGQSSVWAMVDHAEFRSTYAGGDASAVDTATLGNNWPSAELPYLRILDLLRTRKIKLLVVHLPIGEATGAHSASRYLWNLSDPEHLRLFLAAPLNNKLGVLAENLMASMRLLTGYVTAPGPALSQLSDPQNFGGILYREGILDSSGRHRPVPDPGELAQPGCVDCLIHIAGRMPSPYVKQGKPLSPWERMWHEALLAKAKSLGIRVVYVLPPTLRRASVPIEIPQMEGPLASVPIVLFPTPVVYPEGSKHPMEDSFYDLGHLNSAGAKIVSHSLALALRRIEEISP